MKKKIVKYLKLFRRKVVNYFMTNRLFIVYVILAFIGTVFARTFSFGNTFNIKAHAVDLGLILIIGSFAYLFKSKNRFKYLLIWLFIYSLIEMINVIYYEFFTSLASFGELATVGQTETVAGSIFEKLSIFNFAYLLSPIVFYFYHKKLVTSVYYTYIDKINRSKRFLIYTTAVALLSITFSFSTATRADYSRLAKQWNRVYIADRFGFILYQFNDLVQTLTPKFSSLFGYEEAVAAFHEFYTPDEMTNYSSDNKYTNIFKGKNVIFVHMESVQSFLMDLEFNGEKVLPTVNKLAREGMYFSNFYPQISTGTSSDTEFTLLTSLMPAASGTVFVSYHNREYNAIPKYFNELGYTTFSMHGNHASMWNRNVVHPKLGYKNMYFEETFTYTEDDVINLGISDNLFFKQAIPILEGIEKENAPYMGTIITLSNHSPFIYHDKYAPIDLSDTFINSEGEKVTTNFIGESAVGNYITSSHSADIALGEFIDYVENSRAFDDTIFVFYGDHDARLSRREISYLYNYNKEDGTVKTEDDINYVDYDTFDHDLNKKTPLIIWSKNKKIQNEINQEVSYVMGMYDVMPTIGNMFGFKNELALGNDIFNIKSKNIVIFPNASFLTKNVYYNNVTGKYKILKNGAVLSQSYIDDCIKYAEKRLEVNNAIIVHDLIKKEYKNLNAEVK